MTRILRIILTFCALLGITDLPIYAQDGLGIPAVINYTKSDYRGGSQTWGISQDTQKRMYFANNDGLLTFDGSHWQLFPLPNNTIIRSLAISPTGRIYVGGQDEIGFFSPSQDGTLTYTSLKDKVPQQYHKFADIWNIALVDNNVYFQTDDRIFEYNEKSIQVHEARSKWTFLGRGAGKIYAADNIGGLMELNGGQWTPVKEGNKLAGILIAGMLSMGKDSIYIITRTKGIYLLNNGSITPHQSGNGLGNYYINSAAKISNAEFVIATSSAGCQVININNNTRTSYSGETGLQNNNVISVYLDANHNLWTGLNSGISYITRNSPIRYLNIAKSNNVSGYSVRIHDNNIYVATSNGLYYSPLTDPNNFTGDNFSLVKNTGHFEAWNLAVVNGQLLLGNDNGAYVVQGNVTRPISTGAGSWVFLPTSTVLPAEDIVVGTYFGLKRLHYENNTFTDLGKIQGTTDSYRFLTTDNNGDIWASHPYRGIYRFNLAQDKKTYNCHLYTIHHGLPSTINNFVFKIRNQVIFATTQGLYEFDHNTNRFIPSGFLSAVFKGLKVRYLTEDKDGDIWFCTEKGMGVVHFTSAGSTNNYAVTYFPELDKELLPGFDNIYPYNKENIFIGSVRGVIRLDYKKYTSGRPAVTVLLGQVKATGKKDSVMAGSFLQTIPGTGPAMTYLPGGYNSLHIEYSSPAYEFQQNIEYSYQLEGYRDEWSGWDTRSEKDFSNLPDGKYTFKVKARDNQQNESAVVSYSFTIAAPWYKSFWAIAGYICIFAGLSYFLYRQHRKKLASLQQKHEEELKRQAYIHHLEKEKNEKEIIRMQNEKLAQEVLLKKKELANTSMHLMEKEDTIIKIKEKVDRLKTEADNDDIKSITDLIKDTEKLNANWDQFAARFDELNDGFLNKLRKKYPQLTNSDLKVCSYIKLNLSNKEMAQILNISVRGVEVSRYRIRKKIGLQTSESLSSFLNQI